MASLRLSPDGKKKRLGWMQQPVLQKKKRGKKRGGGGGGGGGAVTTNHQGRNSIQKSRSQLSKLTEQSRCRRMRREGNEVLEVGEQSAEDSYENVRERRSVRLEKEEKEEKEENEEKEEKEEKEDDFDSTSYTFLTGSDLMMSSPPKRIYRQLALSQRSREGGGVDKRGRISGEEENDENLSLTFLTSGAINSPNSPRLSKRVKGNRQQRRSQNSNVVSRSLGRAVW
jgi:hypothetical protein